jgi:translation initiation factor 2 subunit 1
MHQAPPFLDLFAACDACQKSIERMRGKLLVKEAARAVSERDDRLLSDKMEQLEAANREVGHTDLPQ